MTASNQTDDLEIDPKTLLKEIKAFGGNATDLDLVLNSNDKVNNDPDLQNDLLKFINALNLPTILDLNDDEYSDYESETDAVKDVFTAKEIDPKQKKTDAKLAINKKDVNTNGVKVDKDSKEVNKESMPDKAAEKAHKLSSESINDTISKLDSSLKGVKPIPASNPSQIDPLYRSMIIQPNPIWYSATSFNTKGSSDIANASMQTAELFTKAKSLYESQVKLYHTLHSSSKSNQDFISTVLKSGTTSDQISCLVLLVQESPLLRWKHFKTLLQMTTKARNVVLVIDSVCDLLVSNLLPDWKLTYFDQQPLENDPTDHQLIQYYFEDLLKKEYAVFITLLEVFSTNSRS
jgi:hypothetical protein